MILPKYYDPDHIISYWLRVTHFYREQQRRKRQEVNPTPTDDLLFYCPCCGRMYEIAKDHKGGSCLLFYENIPKFGKEKRECPECLKTNKF